ncbi:hypothetical protein H8E77_06800 [bacterium]|nr:hypothetical protein [bacterium]
MLKTWIKENRNSVTHLNSYGIYITLMPNAIKQINNSPNLQKAIEDGFVKQVYPVWDEEHKARIAYHELISKSEG